MSSFFSELAKADIVHNVPLKLSSLILWNDKMIIFLFEKLCDGTGQIHM